MNSEEENDFDTDTPGVRTDRRIIALIDMDAFYVQVEQNAAPEFLGLPAAVVQAGNTWKGGGIIALNYEAKACGVKRGMRGDEATRRCPNIKFFVVNERHGKAELSKYRAASRKVFDSLQKTIQDITRELRAPLHASASIEETEIGEVKLERASIDEGFIDLTPVVDAFMSKFKVTKEARDPNSCSIQMLIEGVNGSHIQGYTPETGSKNHGIFDVILQNLEPETLRNCFQDIFLAPKLDTQLLRLLVGAYFLKRMRDDLDQRTNYKASAGISTNKILAKVAAGLHKPNGQTVLVNHKPKILHDIYEKIPMEKIRNLGGKLGQTLKDTLGIQKSSDLIKYSLEQYQSVAHVDQKTAEWLYYLARGYDSEPVVERQAPKSIGCSKNFPGPTCLKTLADVWMWMWRLSDELLMRVEDACENYEELYANGKKPTKLIVGWRSLKNPNSMPTTSNPNYVFMDTNEMASVTRTLNYNPNRYANYSESKGNELSEKLAKEVIEQVVGNWIKNPDEFLRHWRKFIYEKDLTEEKIKSELQKYVMITPFVNMSICATKFEPVPIPAGNKSLENFITSKKPRPEPVDVKHKESSVPPSESKDPNQNLAPSTSGTVVEDQMASKKNEENHATIKADEKHQAAVGTHEVNHADTVTDADDQAVANQDDDQERITSHEISLDEDGWQKIPPHLLSDDCSLNSINDSNDGFNRASHSKSDEKYKKKRTIQDYFKMGDATSSSAQVNWYVFSDDEDSRSSESFRNSKRKPVKGTPKKNRTINEFFSKKDKPPNQSLTSNESTANSPGSSSEVILIPE